MSGLKYIASANESVDIVGQWVPSTDGITY